MAALQCEICGGKLIAKAGGLFECDSCGMQYDKTRIQEMVQEIKGTVKVEGMVEVKGTITVEGASNKDSFLRRGELALESRKWAEAMICYDNALNADPECAQAYLGKVCAEYRCSVPDQLAQFKNAWIYKSDSFQKACRFGSPALKSQLQGYEEQIKENIRAEKYHNLCKQYSAAKEISDYQTCAEAFEKMGNYRDCAALAQVCRQTVAELQLARENRRQQNLAIEQQIREKVALARNMLSVGSFHCVAVNCNGKAHVIGKNMAEVSQWTQLKMAVCIPDGVVGLRKDGTCCVFHKYDRTKFKPIERWSNIKLIDSNNDWVVGLRYNGTVISNVSGVENWQDITDITVGYNFILGLKSNGTVVSCGTNADTSAWTDVVMLGRGGSNPIAIKSDGTVYGYNATLTEGVIAATGCMGAFPPAFVKPDGTMYYEHIYVREGSDGNYARARVRRLKEMKDVVAVYPDGKTLFVLFKDGRIRTYFESGIGKDKTEELCLFDDYDAYAEPILRQMKEKEEAVRRKHLQSQLWTQAGLCPNCGGTFKKGFFGIKCTGCGRSK